MRSPKFEDHVDQDPAPTARAVAAVQRGVGPGTAQKFRGDTVRGRDRRERDRRGLGRLDGRLLRLRAPLHRRRSHPHRAPRPGALETINFHAGRYWPLEAALWDLYGKVCGQPVAKLFGGATDRVPAYASCGELKPPAERAEELGSGLLVLGSRSLGTVKRLVLGSVSEEVVSLCRRPTLVMRGGDGSWPPETVIVGDAGSEQASKAAKIGVRLASLSGAEALLVRASFPPPSYPTSEWSRQSDLRERVALAREWELYRVENILRKRALELESETGLRPKVQAVEGEAATAVLESAEEAGASTLIAMGRRGLGKVQRTVLGSVSTKILRASHVPVLVCR